MLLRRVLVAGMLVATARADEQPLEIVVVKHGGIAIHAEVAEEFAERCRVRARVVNLDGADDGQLRSQLPRSAVVLAIGQRAVEAVVGSRARVVAALAPMVTRGVIAADAQPQPELLLKALKAARPSVRRVGMVVGPGGEPLVRAAAEAARSLGLLLIAARAVDGPHAVQALLRLAPQVDALWLPPEPEVLAAQVFRYALSLEIERGLPLLAASRQQVKSGALLAVDAEPRAVGRQAAEIANRLLAGEDAARLVDSGQTGSLEISVNADVARRLSVDVRALVALGARIE